MTEVTYSAFGMRHKYNVYGSGSKWYIEKRTRAGNKKVGKPQIVASEHTAKLVANRRAHDEGALI